MDGRSTARTPSRSARSRSPNRIFQHGPACMDQRKADASAALLVEADTFNRQGPCRSGATAFCPCAECFRCSERLCRTRPSSNRSALVRLSLWMHVATRRFRLSRTSQSTHRADDSGWMAIRHVARCGSGNLLCVPASVGGQGLNPCPRQEAVRVPRHVLVAPSVCMSEAFHTPAHIGWLGYCGRKSVSS